MDEEEFNRGIILPQLLTQLRKILDQYPDDTQIFKELIQNAEDAKATEVKFLYDRCVHGRDSKQLFSPGFDKFQGSALYSFNNGVFGEEDWKGLRMMCESVKHGDPFKVGYFGMGFKSVFHFTDLPSVISGDKLAYIDPQKQFFNASSRAWNLSNHPELLGEFRHQVDPYLGIFGCNEETFTTGEYRGTLFRFPLRLKPSQLSSQPYSHDKVVALIESFRSEAHLLPLFLRHIESIEIYQRDSIASEPRLLFSVRISPECLKEVRESRKDFMMKTQKSLDFLNKPIISTHKLVIETNSSASPSVQHKFLVCNYFCGNQLSASFINLLKDSDLNYLPWVGAAMPLMDTELDGEADEGRFFCFLPLNLEEGYSSGLTVHLNGFFALEQNRKHLKWPGAYANRSRDDLMDKRVRWNVCLMKEALPKCYFHLIREAIRLNSLRADLQQVNGNDHTVIITEQMIYKAFPNFETIDRRWESLLVPLYSELLRQPCIRTAGQWVEPQNAVFHTLDPESDLSKIILEILSENSVRIACVPPHVFRAIKKCCRINVSEVSPSLVANSCRSLQRSTRMSVFDKLNTNQKLELLHYFVTHNKFDALDGLDLLPLQDGSFQTFHYNPKKADRTIYIATDQRLMKLLPGAEKDLLFVGLNEEITKLLLKASSKGMTQLKPLDPEAIADLIPKCFPVKLRNKIGKSSESIEWMPGSTGHPAEGWLESVWNFLINHSPRDLSKVEKLPLLPVKTYFNKSGEKVVELFPLLDYQNVRILRSNEEMQLGKETEDILVKLGISVLDEIPEYIRLHPLAVRNFVFLPNYLGILKALDKLCRIQDLRKVLEAMRFNTSDEDKRKLRELFSKMSPYEVHDDFRLLLEHLPLFEAVTTSAKSQSSEPKFVSFRDCRVAAPFERIDFPLSSLLLDISDISSQSLGKLLGVKQLNLVELLIKVVFRDIEEAYYDREQIKEVMLHVLKLYHRFNEPDASALKNSLHSLPFIERNDLFVRVSHFFCPENELMKKLFAHEKRFPDKDYLDPLVLPVLKEIGLRNLESIDAEDIREAAESVEFFSNALENEDGKFREVTINSLEEKSAAIVEIFQRFPEKLSEECSSGASLGVALRSIKWTVCEQHRPPLYPKTLLWYGNEKNSKTNGRLMMPLNMTSLKYASLAGSVLPISTSNISFELEQALGWGDPPGIDVVVQHLKNVIMSYSNQEKMAYSEMVRCIYSELSNHPVDDVKRALEIHEVPKEWIWTGEGFVSENRVVINQPFMDLRPFIFNIPLEINSVAEFLEKTGNLKKSCCLTDVLKLIREKHENLNGNKGGLKNGFSLADIRKDLHLCVCILNELKSLVQSCESDEKKSNLLEDFKQNLCLPVLIEHSNSLKLAPLSDCTFCDEEWLRQGYNISEFGINDEDSASISLVHPNVPASTSEVLGVPTLMSRMLDAEELDISFGQSDSLTHRLNTLILEYADGFAIPKELVQNADDAGATEVCFLYDERENEDAKTCLLDEGMKECQGPALWVYNNAVFEDSDFENITKLNGATKLRQPDKIGKFGLGFNAVYNLTDIPSFVSRHNIVIFDPHTYHLGKSIKDKRKPGIRIDLRRHKRNLKRFGNQFKPYNNIFGCNLMSENQMDSYQGTLFRLPLRTRVQASRSEISSKHYDDREMKELLRMIISSCENLLLFSQNVVKVSIYHLPKKGNPLTHTVELFSMEKQLMKVLRGMPTCSTPEENYRSLRAASTVLRKIRRDSNLEVENPIDSSIIIRLNSKCHDLAKQDKLADAKLYKDQNVSCSWLLSTCMGTAESLKMAIQDDSLVPCVTVAARIQCLEDEVFVPLQLTSGAIFSFMPLPIRSGLPIHINGSFAVTSNRKFLCSKSEDDKFDLRPVWNEFLLKDAACTAYIKTLEYLASICQTNETTEFFLLWPNPSHVDPCCGALLTAFYERLTSQDSKDSLFSDGNSWAPFSRTMYLEFGFSNSVIGRTAYEVFNDLSSDLLNNNSIVAFLPCWLEDIFATLSNRNHLYLNSFDMVRFFTEVFIPNVNTISATKRDKLLLHALSLENEHLNDLIANHACIPVTPDGSTMRSTKELVDPTSPLAKMFVDQDGRFPLAGSSYVDSNNLRLLRSIGMKHEVTHFSLDDLVERAIVISNLQSDEVVLRSMVTAVLDAIAALIEFGNGLKKTSFQDEFRRTPFLPVMKRPQSFPLPWKENYNGVLLKPCEIYAPESFDLVCCVRPVVDVSVFPATPRLEIVKNYLLLNSSDQEPTIEAVLGQLDVITTNFLPSEGIKAKSFDTVQAMCFKIYDFFQQNVGRMGHLNKQSLIDALKEKPFIITTESFLSPENIAFNFHHSLCSPYLFSVPDNLKRNFYDLLKSVGVRDQFDVSDYMKALQTMRLNFGDSSLDKATLRKAIHLVSSLGECMSEHHLKLEDVNKSFGIIFMPDSQGFMKPAHELCYNEPDCKWLPSNDSSSFSHPLIPFTISKQLGVNTNRLEVLKKHSRGIGFGQREKLTNRIRRILDGYPCDKEILKELLQNADDAGANEISFIKDSREHDANKIFDKSWKPLQGPSLCVYNNVAFNEEDLDAIQKLGEGSKRNDPNKTGQYGVGFNCVYHLTDAPSFLTCGPKTPETLCVFDPHAKFVPESTVQEPGRRFQNVDQLKTIFTDVFKCYLEDKFDLKNGTMFRLPLRNPEMAKSSEISDRVISPDDIGELFQKFASELSECMLFMNNIRQVTLYEIDKHTGKMVVLYKVMSTINEADSENLKQFTGKISNKLSFIKSGQLKGLAQFDTSYQLIISNDKGLSQKWLVSKSFGFDKNVEVCHKVVEAFQNKELMLMPLGGVAALLENIGKIGKKRTNRLFCLLPLAIKSEFPVHINGHFAIDYEARRNLWYDESESDPKTEWNKLLFQNVVSRAYVALLQVLTSFIPQIEEQQAQNKNSNQLNLTFYNELLPILKDDATLYWKLCGTSIYQMIVRDKVKILPMFTIQTDGKPKGLPQLKWVTLGSSDNLRPMFDNLDSIAFKGNDSTNKNSINVSFQEGKVQVLREILTSLRYPLLALPLKLLECFKMSQVDVECVTPASVINYLHLCSPSFSKCSLDKLPRPIADTSIKSMERLKILLYYFYMDEPHFFARLEGLPLLLTADGCLRVFSSKSPIYCSEFSDIFSGQGQRFVHPSLNLEISKLQTETSTDIFAEFNMGAFSGLLPLICSEKVYCKGSVLSEKMLETGPFSAELLSRVWSYIRQACENVDRKDIETFLKPVENWCLLPIKFRWPSVRDGFKQSIRGLLSVKHLKVVIDYSRNSLVSPAFKACLSKINVPDLDYDALRVRSDRGLEKNDPNFAFVRQMISSIDDPPSLLVAMSYAMETNRAQLNLSDSSTMLKYFASSLESWKNDSDSINLLRNLCLHVTTDEILTSLKDFEAIFLNEEIPKLNLQVWKLNSGVLFLKFNPLFTDMYLALNCRVVSPSQMYLDFILSNMRFIEQNEWIQHVQYLKDKILNDEKNASNKSFILENLRSLEFINRGGMNRKFAKASDYFDPRNATFKTLFSGHPEMFPPAPFNDYKWLDFLKQIGLQFCTTKELCLRFAKEIESEARKGSTELTYERSKVLINDILSPANLADVEFLESISTVKFIPQAKLKSILKNVHLSFGKTHKFISFQEGILEQYDVLVWTSSFLIPQWADPFKALALHVNGHPNGPDQQPNLKNKISLALKLKDQPPLQLVITHLKNLCSCDKKSAPLKEDSEFNCFVRTDSLKKVYHHLQTRLSKQDEDDYEDVLLQIEQLSEFPCVVTNMGKNFVFPKEVVIDLREEDQILPHLWKLPTELGELEQLFLKMGMSKKVADIHYANVLNSLQKSVSKKKMHPNELRVAFKAVAGLFNILHQTKIHSELLNQFELLYLPTSTGYFEKSSDLIYNDEPSWTERIKKLSCPFLVNLSECGLQTKLHLEMIKLLPSHLRPQMLSSVVSEVLENSICSSPNVHTVADKLTYQLSSRAFAFGLARLIKHEHRKSTHKFSNEVIESIQQQFASLQVSGIDKVQTFLQCSGQRIPESENNSCTFVEKMSAAEDEISWKIYIDRYLKLDDELQVSISEVVNKITGGLLKNSIHYIQPILSCPPHTISKVLDRLKVRPDRQNSDDIVTSILPVAGSLIPVEDHHLLKEDFEEFEAGEYVGYELDDELNGEATIIYAIVVQKTHNVGGNVTQLNGISEKMNSKDESACINLKYLINVGDERELVEVLSADLYKFQRIDKIFKSTDSYDSPRPSPDHRSNSPCFHSNKPSPEPQSRSSLSPRAVYPTKLKLENVRRKLFGTSNGGLEDEAKKEKNSSRNHDRSPFSGSPIKSPKDSEDNVFKIPIINEELDDAKAEVANILEEAWKMPEVQRKKVVKRLLLKWHPDKNMDNEYFATVVTQFIYNKIESLEMSLPCPKTFEDFRFDAHPDPRNPFAGEKSFQENFYKAYQKFSEHLNRRAKEQKEQRERYKENFAREFYPQKGTQFNFHVPPTFASTNPQPALAKRFLRQAQEDLNAVHNDLNLKANPAFEWACFKAHQAAEKSLKAAQFFVDASISFSHDLVVLASSLEDLDLRSLAQRLQNVVGSSNKLYNPEPIDFMVIPHDKYTQEMAEKSVGLAKSILERVTEIIEFKE